MQGLVVLFFFAIAHLVEAAWLFVNSLHAEYFCMIFCCQLIFQNIFKELFQEYLYYR